MFNVSVSLSLSFPLRIKGKSEIDDDRSNCGHFHETRTGTTHVAQITTSLRKNKKGKIKEVHTGVIAAGALLQIT